MKILTVLLLWIGVASAALVYVDDVTSLGTEGGVNYYDLSGGAADPWTPSNITTEAWYDASDTNTITQSGGLVSQWDDKSGNTNDATQGTGSLQPVFTTNALNGLPAIVFDGNDDWLDISGSFSVSNVFVVLNYTKGAVFDYWDWAFGAIGGGDEAYGGIVGVDANTTIYTKWATAYVNGETGGSTVMGFAPLSSYKMVGAVNVTNVAVRADWQIGDGHGNWEGGIAEIVVTDSEMTEADRQKMEGYLAHKWGLEDDLPTNHPCKASAPTQ